MESKSHKIFKAQCPGSLMIVGEHAVLHGEPAIVGSINKCLQVKLEITERPDLEQAEIIIETCLNPDDSEDLLTYSSSLKDLKIIKPLEYVLTAVDNFKNKLLNFNYNYKFEISSNINPNMGLGSSAAVTVAMVQVLTNFLRWKNEQEEYDFTSIRSGNVDRALLDILIIAKNIVATVQGKGSGADVAASFFGGVLYYKADLSVIEKIARNLPVIAVYSGYKLSTSKVIAKVDAALHNLKDNKQAAIYTSIFSLIGDLVSFARDCITQQHWDKLGELFNTHYELQVLLELSDNNINNIINKLKSDNNITGAKISGSGLGDCVIAICKNYDVVNMVCGNFSGENIQLNHNVQLLEDVEIR